MLPVTTDAAVIGLGAIRTGPLRGASRTPPGSHARAGCWVYRMAPLAGAIAVVA